MNGLQIVWDSLKNIFGSVFLWFLVIGILLVLIEALVWQISRKGQKKQIQADEVISTSQKRIAVITGASSGLGRLFAKEVDRSEKEIDEIWLIARRQDRLERLSRELTHQTKVLALDLAEDSSFGILEELFKEEKVHAGLLIHCAGYGRIGNYAAVSRQESDRLIRLNCKAAVDITLTVLPYMKAGDRIIEICSTAAFQPLQHLNLYAASKSFLYHYSRALRLELLPRKIAVTAVCPYWIKNTEFISSAREHEEGDRQQSPVRGFPFASKAEKVVKAAMRSSRAGLAVSTPGVFCFLHRLFSKVISREALLYFWELLRRV